MEFPHKLTSKQVFESRDLLLYYMEHVPHKAHLRCGLEWRYITLSEFLKRSEKQASFLIEKLDYFLEGSCYQYYLETIAEAAKRNVHLKLLTLKENSVSPEILVWKDLQDRYPDHVGVRFLSSAADIYLDTRIQERQQKPTNIIAFDNIAYSMEYTKGEIVAISCFQNAELGSRMQGVVDDAYDLS